MFSKWDPQHISKFNSDASSKFLEMYETCLSADTARKASQKPHQTFAASSFWCDRKSWFRLRGTDPDNAEIDPDVTLRFNADLGTACHTVLQTNLKQFLGSNWLTLDSYLHSIEFPYDYTLTLSENSLETQLEIADPPIRMSCDGIVRVNNTVYLLEIKTIEYNTWKSLTQPMSKHIDQVKCYGAILSLPHVLFLYMDRQYGSLKCYEYTLTQEDIDSVFRRIKYVQECVEYNLAPDPLPKGSSWCTPSMCPYYHTCTKYGGR